MTPPLEACPFWMTYRRHTWVTRTKKGKRVVVCRYCGCVKEEE